MIRRVGFVIPTLATGGAERVVATLATALSDHFETHIFVQRVGFGQTNFSGVTLHEVPLIGTFIMRGPFQYLKTYAGYNRHQ